LLLAFTPACPDCNPDPVDPQDGGAEDGSVTPAPDAAGPIDPCTDGVTVFGPETFTRVCGPPLEEWRQFSVPEDGDICVLVTNNGVSAAKIKIDGSVLIGPNQFNPNVTDISATTGVAAGDHELYVRIESAPGTELTIEIRFADPPPATPYCSEVARAWCEDKGWTVVNSPPPSAGNIVCTVDGRAAQNNCDDCSTYNIVVWKDGSEEQFCPGTYSTEAGKVYGGHAGFPCQCGDDLEYCGTWDMQGCTPDP
jgi:hypothetical protein